MIYLYVAIHFPMSGSNDHCDAPDMATSRFGRHVFLLKIFSLNQAKVAFFLPLENDRVFHQVPAAPSPSTTVAFASYSNDIGSKFS